MIGYDAPKALEEWEVRCHYCGCVMQYPYNIAEVQKAKFCNKDCADKWKAKYGNEAKHFDEGKAPLEQIPYEALKAIAEVFLYGQKKYNRFNWCAGMAWMKLAGSCCRHLYKWIGGEDKDDESGLSHLAHLGADVMMLIWYVQKGRGTDDRYTSNG